MPRRDGPFTDLMTVASKLPWKVGVGLAIVGFVALHLVAAMTASPIKATVIADLGPVYVHTLIHILAYFFQAIIPAGLLIGAIASFIKQKKRGSQFAGTAVAPKLATSVGGLGSPVCPRCGMAMVERTAKRGNAAGQKFWGCSSYPKCSGTRRI